MTEPVCADCETTTPVHVVMKPGQDGKEWWLCVRCYCESTKAERVRGGQR